MSCLGCVVGTGNIWRFPRIVAKNSGEDGKPSIPVVLHSNVTDVLCVIVELSFRLSYVKYT